MIFVLYSWRFKQPFLSLPFVDACLYYTIGIMLFTGIHYFGFLKHFCDIDEYFQAYSISCKNIKTSCP